MIAVRRSAAIALALSAVSLPLAAQAPGGNAKNLPPHVQEQLWPEREMTPVEHELRERVYVMRDSLTRVHATVSMLQRQQRSQASAAVIRSTARALAAECVRSGRVADSMAVFAAGFSSNDPKWGEPTVRAYRAALSDLVTGMRRCHEVMTAQVEATETAAGDAVGRYDRAEKDLFRTLKIRLDPRGA